MDLRGECLILVADGHRARLFEERRRGGPLFEITECLGDLKRHGARARAHAGRVFDRFGPASHTTDASAPRDKDERRFISLTAGRLDALLRERPFAELVLMAPPRALGHLRSALSPAVEARLRSSEPRERVKQSSDQIRTALRDLRLPSA